ncbi:heparan-alpha-glucosaminide N-acetyltransferase domain-containing protein [Pseudonocardia sp.]|uniref:heparan-alpha-glucosaminide N-acetyltransferase domain-containing protein n=1 Tax=Pseudonocardia sp. TaxID=60912 RepID=UPI003D11B53A
MTGGPLDPNADPGRTHRAGGAHRAHPAAGVDRAPAGRLAGVDAARGAALVGMVATHTLLLRDGGEPTLTEVLAHGRASALFAVVAGVGIALSTGGMRPPRGGELLPAAVGLAVRAVLIAAIGLLLVELDPPVLVILAFYGLLFAVAIPLLPLRVGVLAAGAVVACVVTPVVSHVLRPGRTATPDQAGLAALVDPGELFAHLALTGFYPVLTWTTYLLAGMAVGRADLRRPATAWWLLGGGAALAAAAMTASSVLVAASGGAVREGGSFLYGVAPTDTWWWLAVDTPHSGTPLDLANTTGSALAVLGAMLLLARYAPAIAWVPAAVGAIPLTLYVLHVMLLAAHPAVGAQRPAVFVAHVAGAVAVGVAVRLSGGRGPLEAGVSAVSRTARDGVRRRMQPAR